MSDEPSQVIATMGDSVYTIPLCRCRKVHNITLQNQKAVKDWILNKYEGKIEPKVAKEFLADPNYQGQFEKILNKTNFI